MMASGRDQGLGPAPRSRIQTILSVSIKVSKEQRLAPGGFVFGQPAPALMGLGKLGYPGSRVIWQHDEPCLLSLGLKYGDTKWFKGRTPHCRSPDCSQSYEVPPGQAQGGKIHGGQLNLIPCCAVGWGCAREQQLYPCWTATLWGWMASCPSAFPAAAIPRGHVVPLHP